MYAYPHVPAGSLTKAWTGYANSIACGVMLAASFDLIHEGTPHGGRQSTSLTCVLLLPYLCRSFSRFLVAAGSACVALIVTCGAMLKSCPLSIPEPRCIKVAVMP